MPAINTAASGASPQLHLVGFEIDHAAGLNLRDAALSGLHGLATLPELARAYGAAGPAWTLMADGWPLACGGVVRFWPGVGELWCWSGAELGRWSQAFARLSWRFVEELLNEEGFHRLQAHVRENDTTAGRFAEFLGLTLEGRCPGYGPDQTTHLLYGRFQQWKG